ncbi:MAG: PilZ domain-containing protein [Phycisphaerales bacterium]
MSNTPGDDRRRFPRQTVVRPCRIRDGRTLNAGVGETSDLSRSGALLRMQRGRMFSPGETIEIGVALDNDPLMRTEDLRPARVVRVLSIDHYHQALAVEFEEELDQALDASAPRSVAA